MSVRGLYVGGKSTGNQNLKRSRRTAPVAQTLGGGAATPEQIGVPALSPRAETQVAALQLERRQEEKELRGGDYVAAPAPTDDLTQIAKALGVFGQQFSNTLEAGIKYEGAEQGRAACSDRAARGADGADARRPPTARHSQAAVQVSIRHVRGLGHRREKK